MAKLPLTFTVTGNTSNRWSMITIRMGKCVYIHMYILMYMYAIVILDVCSHLSPKALAVYSRSPAAFEALSSFKILQLPSSTTLKSYV